MGGTSIYGNPPPQYGPLTLISPQASAHGHTGSALAVGTVTVGAPRKVIKKGDWNCSMQKMYPLVITDIAMV